MSEALVAASEAGMYKDPGSLYSAGTRVKGQVHFLCLCVTLMLWEMDELLRLADC